MAETVVARHGQITLSKALRDALGIHEGDKVIVNREGGRIVVSKKDPSVWERVERFLPDDFEKTLKGFRQDARERFKRLGIA